MRIIFVLLQMQKKKRDILKITKNIVLLYFKKMSLPCQKSDNDAHELDNDARKKYIFWIVFQLTRRKIIVIIIFCQHLEDKTCFCKYLSNKTNKKMPKPLFLALRIISAVSMKSFYIFMSSKNLGWEHGIWPQ